ncbi:hypothetical protein Trydic_g16089 [Trypoxylus dichotomus]
MVKLFFEEGSIRYTQLTRDRLKDAAEVGKSSFFKDETICKALSLENNAVAIEELEELFVKAAEDGVSIIAIDNVNNSIVAVSFNKLQAKDYPDIEYYQKYSDRCSDETSQAFLSFMKGTDLVIDMFEYCQADCYLEIMFLGVLSSHRGKSIAYNLCRASETLAQILFSGEDVKQSITDGAPDLKPPPKFVSAIFTSRVSQRIGQKLKMKVAGSANLDEWMYNGKTFAERLGCNITPIQYCYKMLQ